MATITAGDIAFKGHFGFGAQSTLTDSNTAVTGPGGSAGPDGWSGNYFDLREDDHYIATIALSSTITNTTNTVNSIEITIEDWLLSVNDNNNNFATDRIFAYPVLKESDGSGNHTYYPDGFTTTNSGGVLLANEIDDELGAKRLEALQFLTPNYEIEDDASELFPPGTTPSVPYSFDASGLTAYQIFKMPTSYMTGWDGKFRSDRTYSIQLHFRPMTSGTATNLGYSGNTYGTQQFAVGFNTADVVAYTDVGAVGSSVEHTTPTDNITAQFNVDDVVFFRKFVGNPTHQLATQFGLSLNTLQQTHREDATQFNISSSITATAFGGFLLTSSSAFASAFDVDASDQIGRIRAGFTVDPSFAFTTD